MRFEYGDIGCTPGISRMLREDPIMNDWITDCLNRHLNGDWGDLCEEDKAMNDESMRMENEGEIGWRLMSAYSIDDFKIWIITEADRSSTTILLPSEY